MPATPFVPTTVNLPQATTMCPDCDPSNAMPLIRNHGGKIGFGCVAGHHFRDLAELRSRKLSTVKPKGQPVGDKYLIDVPKQTVERLTERFGERRDATVGAVMTAMAVPGTFIVGGHDLAELSREMGGEVRGVMDLIALAKDRKRELVEAKSRAEQPGENAVDGVNVRLSDPDLEHVRELARFRGVRPAEVLEKAVRGLLAEDRL